MNNEKTEIDLFDWKCQAVSLVEKIWWKKVEEWTYSVVVWNFNLKWNNISMDMPNFCALYLDMANRLYNNSNWYLTFKNFQKWRPVNHKELFSFIQDRISNIIFSFTWFEAFLNENIWSIENYNKDYKYRYKDKDWNQTEKWIKKIIDLFSINQKVNVIYSFYEIKENKDINNKIKKISELRKRLIHFKRKDTIESIEWTIFNDLLDKDFINYAILVYEIIDYFIKNSNKNKWFSAYWYKRPDNCFNKDY